MNMGKERLVSICISVAIVMAAFIVSQAQVTGTSEYSGRATGINSVININGASTTTVTGDTCPLPARGGTSTVTTSGSLITGILGTGTVVSTTSGVGLTSQSSSSVSDFYLNAGGWIIKASNVTTRTQCSCCDIAAPACNGETNINGLTVTDPTGANFAVTVNGQANQVVNLPNGAGTITFNERSSAPGSLTVNGMHINIAAGGNTYNVVVASSHSDILCGSVVITPSNVNVSGRVLDTSGAAIPQASVTLSNDRGQIIRSAMSGMDGSYQFTEVQTGQTYVVQANHKAYTFQPRAINLLDEMTDVNLIGTARTMLRFGR
jgi:hypothetical protein